jgi:cell division protein FtsQ
MTRWTNILKWGLLLAYFPVMLSFVSVSRRSTVCSDVKVVVKDSLSMRFVDSEEIRASLIKKYPEMLGFGLNHINFNEVEDYVTKHKAVKSCEVYETLKGVVHVEVKQHVPMLRLFTSDGSYYLDKEGDRIPVSKRYAARTLVVNGTIPHDLNDLLNVGRFITEDEFWNAQFEQIYIRRNNDYILVPRVGDHQILLGPPVRVAEKLRNLRALYEQGLSPTEWNDYKWINLKYKNQVLCSRNRNW